MKQPDGSFQTCKQIVLASGSPRRKELLESAGLDFSILPAQAEEPEPEAGESPREYALRMAQLKAEDVFGDNSESVVIAADTVVTVDGRILGKPDSEEHAVEMLRMLADRTHVVVTACCLLSPPPPPPSSRKGKSQQDEEEPERLESCFAMETWVRFVDPPLKTLRAYAATGEPMDKAGAYAIQGVGAFLVRSIEGSYTNVVGLPLAEVVEVLTEWSAIKPRGG